MIRKSRQVFANRDQKNLSPLPPTGASSHPKWFFFQCGVFLVSKRCLWRSNSSIFWMYVVTYQTFLTLHTLPCPCSVLRLRASGFLSTTCYCTSTVQYVSCNDNFNTSCCPKVPATLSRWRPLPLLALTSVEAASCGSCRRRGHAARGGSRPPAAAAVALPQPPPRGPLQLLLQQLLLQLGPEAGPGEVALEAAVPAAVGGVAVAASAARDLRVVERPLGLQRLQGSRQLEREIKKHSKHTYQ